MSEKELGTVNIDDILEAMDDLLDKAMGVPLSGGKCIVDIGKFRDLISDVRLNIPAEVKQAKLIVADRAIILNDAKKEAELIVRKAEDKVKLLVANEEIVKQAQIRGTEIMSQAQARAKELRYATNEYVDNLLAQAEELLVKDLGDIKRTRTALKSSKHKPE